MTRNNDTDEPIAGDYRVVPNSDRTPPSGAPDHQFAMGDDVPVWILPIQLNVDLVFGVDVEVFELDGEICVYPQTPVLVRGPHYRRVPIRRRGRGDPRPGRRDVKWGDSRGAPQRGHAGAWDGHQID